MTKSSLSPRLLNCIGLSVCLALAACGGGGARPISGPGPTPTPTPSPTPTPTPTGSFDTAEVRRSDGPEFHNAITAWSQGQTGAGETIAIIDSGIDTDSPEFAGRIHPDSTDLAGNNTIEAVDDHGTNVALVAAAALDDTGVVGIAFDAQVLVLRADRPGSCTATESDPDLAGCQFFDRDIALGVDQAVASGATVINISLGGSPASSSLRDAITRAAAAGVVIIVAAGNAGDGSDPNNPADQPDTFAQDILQLGGPNVIIVGSVDENGQFSAFSNRAGDSAASYLTARGERICCVYENGVLKVETDNSGNQFVTLFSGTSFSAPQVAGAVAILAQAFPNLTGAQIVEILLDTARDAGATGTDTTYGRGILDIGRAVSPQGTTRLPGTTVSLALSHDTATGSAAMGDALTGQSLGSIILDKYDRAYGYDMGTRLRGAALDPRLEGAVQQGHRRIALAGGQVSMAFTVDAAKPVEYANGAAPLRLTQEDAQAARVLAAQVAMRLSPETTIGLAFSQGSDGMAAHLQGQTRPAFLIAGRASGDSGFLRSDDVSVAVRHELGGFGITATASSGEALLGTRRRAGDFLAHERERYGMARLGLAADRQFGPVKAVLGFDFLAEERTVLGGYFHQAFGADGARSLFVDASLGWDMAPGWWLGASGRLGRTDARSAGLVEGSDIRTNAWSLDLVRTGVVQAGDTLGLRIAQPLRVESGGLSLNLPVAYDYASETASFGTRRINLAPEGREIMAEFAWRGAAFGGEMAASAFYRRDPGHYAYSPDDKGLVLRWLREF